MFRKYSILAAISLVGVFLLGFATYPYRVGVSPDSVNYLSAAKNLVQGNGLVTNVIRWNNRYESIPFIFWPPLYPVVIAGVHQLGLGLIDASWLLNLGQIGRAHV